MHKKQAFKHMIQSRSLSINENKQTNIEMFVNSFLHYRGGGNLDYKGDEYHKRKTALFTTFLNS
jgi:hypothetical protein